MEKAFDLKDLASRLAGKGKHIAEEDLKIVAGEIFDWTHESVVVSGNPLLGMLDAAVLPKLKDLAMEGLDKVDGVVGN